MGGFYRGQQTTLRPHFVLARPSFTFEFADYIEAGVVGSTVLFSANYSKLADIVDPYRYFNMTAAKPWASPSFFDTMPKLVVNAGNDEFFLPDDDHSWWGSLPGEKLGP